MLSAHEMSLRRISWGMAAVALVTVSGLVLTASGSRAAQQVAAITDKVDSMHFGRLADWVAQPASASEIAAPAAPKPLPQVVAASDQDRTPPSPPPVPVDDRTPPVPSAPPVRPHEDDERIAAHAIPSEAEIRHMVPHVDIASGCEDGKNVTRSETVDAEGRRHIRVRVCQTQIEAQAHRAARAGLIAARAQIAAAAKMSDKIRADVLRDLDKEIARMDGEE